MNIANNLAKAGLQIAKIKERGAYEGRLIDFAEYVWPVVEPAIPFIRGWAIDAIADHLQGVTEGHIKRLLMNVPPGFTKSLMTDVFWPAYEWGPRDMPWLRYVCASYSNHLTERDNMRCRNIVISDRYQRMWSSRFKISNEQFTKIKFANDKTGWKLATSVGGIGVGERGDRFIIDDPNNTMDMESAQVRDTTNLWFTEVVPDRLNNPQKSAIVIIQQRLHEDDVSGIALSREMGYTHLCVPMYYVPRTYVNAYNVEDQVKTFLDDDVDKVQDDDVFWEDPRQEDGELAWPERFPLQVCTDLERDKGPYAWCSSGEAPVLMGDLSLKPISEVKKGDQITGFVIGNNQTRARLKVAEVLSISVSHRPIVRMTLDSGEVIRCTPDHKWWTGRNDKSHAPYAPAKIGTTLFRVCPPRPPNQEGRPSRLPLYQRFLHIVKPTKWRNRLIDSVTSGRLYTGSEKVVSIHDDGIETVYGLETTTGNYVVWGLASSNSGQYMQMPAPRGGAIIKRDFWQNWDKPKFEVEYILASIDTASTDKEENDPSAMTIWGVFRDEANNPKIVLMYAWQERLQFHELVQRILDTCSMSQKPKSVPQFPVDRVLIEAKANGISVGQELHRLIRGTGKYGVELNPVEGDKYARLLSVQHLFSDEMIYAPLKKAYAEMVVNQCAIFPKGSHDDLVDTTSQALRYLRDQGFALRREEYAVESYEEQLFRSPGSRAPLYGNF